MASFTAALTNLTNSSDANFRAWGSYIAAKLLAVGMVQTSDTGQINWTTVTAPLAASTYQGYEIWRFADALQATFPVYIKIQYGSAPSSANNPGLGVQFGSGSNGSGTLTGNLSAVLTVGATATATAGTWFGSGSTNRFCICPVITGTNGFYFGFERSLDANGDVTGEYVFWWAHNNQTNSSIAQTQVWSTTLGSMSPALASTVAALFPSATGITGTQTIVAPVFPEKGVFGNPCLNLVGYYTGDITESSTISVYMYGVAHTYYCIPAANAIASTTWRGAGNGTESMAIRYE